MKGLTDILHTEKKYLVPIETKKSPGYIASRNVSFSVNKLDNIAKILIDFLCVQTFRASSCPAEPDAL